MGLNATALVSVEDLKGFMGGLSGSGQDPRLEEAINAASAIVSEDLGRILVGAAPTTPFAVTEYHTILENTHELCLLDWPIVSVTSIHEDGSRTYDATTLLTPATDYIIDGKDGRILRVTSGGGARAWLTGFEAIKVVALVGYKDQAGNPAAAANLPSDLKDVCCWIAARLFQESERKGWDISSVTDGLGSMTRFTGSRLPPMMQERLRDQRAYNRHPTGRRV
jgi:hypothetical protein